MENINEINGKIAKNLTYYRKAAGLTQAELAEKINYSDKSVSKWEQGNGVPDVYILLQLADLYHVTLNDLVGETKTKGEICQTQKKRIAGIHLLIMLLSSGIVWLVATCFFVLMQLLQPVGAWWITFVYAVMANAIVLIVYAGIWKYRLLNFFSVSVLIWTTITSIYLTVTALIGKYDALWLLFLLGVPLQVLETLWVFFRSFFHKIERSKKKKRVETADADTLSQEI